ncbi:MAG: carbohydrate binding family 9 domain-containing protein, partial [Phycisphaerales bacterium]
MSTRRNRERTVRRWALASVAGAAMATPALRADPTPTGAEPPDEKSRLPLAAPPRWSLRATRLEDGATAPTVDGRLDDEAWSLAAPFEDFTQVDPVQGAPPTERTLARVVYTADALYIAVRCFDSNPGGILARQMRRDASLDDDDRVSVSIDPFLTERDGYYFELGPAGGKFDGLIENNRDIRGDWDGIWNGRATIDDEGWSAEFRIPMKTVAFSPENDAWGLNIQRVIQRKRETVRWATPTRSSGLRRLSDAGRVEGLTGLRQGLGLDVKPT